MSSRTHSEILLDKIGLMGGSRMSASERLWNHGQLRELMPWALVRAYYVSNASVPLMQTALAECQRLAGKDPVAKKFATFLAEHIPEEVGHDEQCLDDLEALGLSRSAVKKQLPWPSLVALIGMQYYWILHRHPIAFVGYAATIEGNPVSVEYLEGVQAKTGLPSEGFRTLIWHARHDPEHSGELCRVIDDMPLTEEQVSLIGVNVAHTNNLLARSVHEMIDAFEERTGRAA